MPEWSNGAVSKTGPRHVRQGTPEHQTPQNITIFHMIGPLHPFPSWPVPPSLVVILVADCSMYVLWRYINYFWLFDVSCGIARPKQRTLHFRLA